MKINDLIPNEYSNFYANYIASVSNEYTLVEELEISIHRFIKFVQDIPMDKFDYRYAEGKWTIKEIIQHLIDAERIFAYRALRFARYDATVLSGFDEDYYVLNSTANQRSIMELLTEYSAVRHSSLLLFKSFTNEQLLYSGIASNNNISVRALGFVIIGHQNHHQKIFEERYL
ncbi:DinB family protein [Flavobacterium croceum DSM 17960]|uniref:DinB family protein n=1 Tax=Flavobacterium croceum DSM 17960 TaxID=1121886 RepID=A0A2S4N666_9FLAO|nr:DinB family protein [Flavobacterium croceum]POS01186.1 DinB family protein [Flavobacterium croceum DSM 17960]